MKLIVFPLIFLIIMAVMGQIGFGEVGFEGSGVQQFMNAATFNATEAGYWLINEGRLVLDRWGNRVAEFGQQWGEGSLSYWLNTTNAYDTNYFNNVDPWSQDESYPLLWLNDNEEFDGSHYTRGQAGLGFIDIGTSTWGVIALITALIILAGIAGLKVFGSGISDISVGTIVKGTGFMALWAIFSVVAYPLITGVEIFGVILYLILTSCYAIGILGQVGGGGVDI